MTDSPTDTPKPRRGRGKRRSEDGLPNPIDIHVGSRVKLRRTLLGMSQDKLGEAIGLTFQQVQKYERGANRIGASRLFELSKVLDVPVSFFFDDMPAATSGGPVPGIAAASAGEPDLAKREILELARAFDRIKDGKVRKSVLELTKSLGRAEVA
ncbi:helix-turn-helix domain-containing protein [Elstera cyanobacteriorum]|uniref:helix-turn-helix domain-containing protein n=1 Tax=Elstera cyanobacteriorum TaxID=2022747 RepID=UPI002353AB42|nr:helix-turn-helix transcriptional regulator [Elstera cyanobacteriorum]MCK6442319.1 helix-turn-helix domain-containing protein [Elstera cyanobacteriorum]